MSDTQNTGADGQQQQQPPVIFNGQYIKDLSFESPNAPGIFKEMQQTQPDTKVSVNIGHAKIENADNDGTYEVVLELNVAMQVGEKTGFICELKFAGVFTLNVPEEHLQAFILIECPRLLFPFARQIISDATQQGGFAPLLLQPIDFTALFQQNLQNHAAEAAKENDED